MLTMSKSMLGEWSKTCRYCEGRAAANLVKLVQQRQHNAVPTVSEYTVKSILVRSFPQRSGARSHSIKFCCLLYSK